MTQNTTPEYRPTLCLDFDGVIHSYTSGWQGATKIPDPPVNGALEFMALALEGGWNVAIHSSRCGQAGGMVAIRYWLKKHEGDLDLEAVEIVREKPAALVTLDDRALTFTGDWPSLAELRAFKPWNRGGVTPAQIMENALRRIITAAQAGARGQVMEVGTFEDIEMMALAGLAGNKGFNWPFKPWNVKVERKVS